MDKNVLPTKRNLIITRNNLILARKGYALLEIKNQATSHELRNAKYAAYILKEKLRDIVSFAERALSLAQMEMGQERADNLWQTLDFEAGQGGDIRPQYPLDGTCAALDEAVLAWIKVIAITKELEEIEATIIRLETRLRRSLKQAAALRNVTIPLYETRVKYISEKIEERERDELARIKAAKAIANAN